jgi:hypothetical protein
MNLNLKAATTSVTIAALLALPGTFRSFASAAEWHSWQHSQRSDPPAVNSDSNSTAPPKTDLSTESVSHDYINAQADAVTFDLTPNEAAHPGNIGIAGPGSQTETSISGSPFIHSEPRAAAPFPLLLNRAVQGYVQNFLDQPEGLKMAFERSRPFLPEMLKLMKQQGIPDDLVYLTFAESDFSKRGKGPWQFTVGTAARFGLRVNKWLDERRDPILSTRAAAEYLAELHDQADNDWRVALIAWNTGAGNLERYWRLEGANYSLFADRLPRRTRQLLNRFMAVAFIAHNSASYGIGDVSYSATPAWTVEKFKGGTTLKSIAAKFETTVAKLRDFNPALRIDRVPPNERAYAIRIPIDEDASN